MADDAGTTSFSDGLRINGDRLWDDLNALSQIGRGGRGITRLAFSEADMEGRRWLLNRFSDAGIPARMDVYGNVYGRLEANASPRPEGPVDSPSPSVLLVGSHIDTVPEGGMFDGALGVLSGLECLRTIKEAGVRLPYALEVIAFANEEGSRLGPGLFGGRALFEGIPQDEWEKVFPVLKQAGLQGVANAGLAGTDADTVGTVAVGAVDVDAGSADTLLKAPGPLIDAKILRGYLELHVEQGGVLDASGEDIGVVQGIVCIHAFSATFKGEANHAGTTPMNRRRDALLGAAELILAVPNVVGELGSGITVGTCGQVRVSPGGRNIVPGEAEISIEVRDLDESVAEAVIEGLRKVAREIAERRALSVDLTRVSRTSGAMMEPDIQEIIERSARDLGLRTRRMPSGAGHDAMTLGKKVPTGMIFVPSIGGISHSPEERTSREQCENGAQVLLRTILVCLERPWP